MDLTNNSFSFAQSDIDSSIDNLNTYYALLNSRLTRLHTEVE